MKVGMVKERHFKKLLNKYVVI